MAGLKTITLGCRLNTFESEVIRELGQDSILNDTIVINTCAVTSEAERQARQAIRRAARENPQSRIIVTGCAAQLNPKAFADMQEVDRVLGNEEKLGAELLSKSGPTIQAKDIMSVDEVIPHPIKVMDGRTRAFVQIQQGCDYRCTYCIIPFARGPNRSIPANAVISQVRDLVTAGHNEIVLTGVDICSYNTNEVRDLGSLVSRILFEVPDLKRLRLSSLDPAAIDDKLLDLLGEDLRLMPHLHLSLQAMDDMILKRMKRRHTRAGAIAIVAQARAARPDAVFGADLIAGFPTETDEMFNNTITAIRELGLTYLHVFPFSPRPGTPAAKMPRVNGSVVKARAAQLRVIGKIGLERFLASRSGAIEQVLVEKNHQGLSQHFALVKLDFHAEPGAIVNARVTATGDRFLIASRAA
jgi:threonylcarbamoyladenosine tRNA methylthiotransferase MtaB